MSEHREGTRYSVPGDIGRERRGAGRPFIVGLVATLLLLLAWGVLGIVNTPFRGDPHVSYALSEPTTAYFQYGYLGYIDTEDTMLNLWFEDTNYGWYNTMWVRESAYMSSLVKFDLSSIPTSASVISATLSLWCTGSGGQTVDVSTYQVLRPWSADEATWNLAQTGVPWGDPGCGSTTTDRVPDPESVLTVFADNVWYTWSLANMVQSWLTTPSSNQGVILRGTGEHFVQFSFATSEYWNKDRRPRLAVRYVIGPLPTPTATGSRTPTPSATPTSTSWLTNTPTNSPTATSTPSVTPTGTIFTPTVTSTPTSTSVTPAGDVEIRIVPNTRTVSVGSQFLLDVMLYAPTQPVDSATVYINFDPAKLQVVDTLGNPTGQIIPDPGSLSIVLANSVNNGAGQIDYIAGAGLPPAPVPSGYFRVASIRFKALAPAAGGTNVTFSFGAPRRTLTLFEGTPNLGSHSNGVVFVIGTPTPTGTRTATATGSVSPTASSTPITPGPTPGSVQLYIDPSPRVVNINDIFTVDVKVNALTQPVDSGAVYIDFDPTYLRIVDEFGNPSAEVIPGPKFTAVFENGVNNTFGTINFQAGIPTGPPPCNGICTVATLRFKAIVPTAGTPILFHTTLPRRTRMVMGGVDQVTMSSAGVVIIGAAGPTATWTSTPTRTSTPTSTGSATVTPTPTGSPTPSGVSIVLNPGLKIVNVADTFDLEVIINSGAQLLDGVEFYVNFDRNVMQVANVIPDLSSFPDNVTGPTWDNVTGKIGYAAGLISGPEPSGSFRVATIRFLATAPAGGSVISFAFHPPSRDTKVSHDAMSWRPVGAGSIVLISATGVATSTPTATPTSITPTPTPSPTATATVPSGPSGTVSGRVVLEGRSNHSGAVVTVGGRSAITASNGTFTVTNVPVGVWTARADAQSYLFADKTGVVVVDGGVVELPDVGLFGGDCSGDGYIDLFDMVIVGMSYQSIPGDLIWDPTADVNGDNVVDIVDLVLIGSNFEKLAPTAWAMF